MTIAVLGTFDSKGHEHQYVADIITELGHSPLLIDVGSYSAAQVQPDITRYAVAEAAGIDLAPILGRQDRGECIQALSEAAATCLKQLVAENRIQGVISLGGGGGTSIACTAMRALPIGFPKLMVSTLASGQTAHYIGSKDITMMPSIVDIAGLNSISRIIFTRAAHAICGMVSARIDELDSKPIIVASMFGNTTQCIHYAKAILENEGYEVLIFHVTGAGGKTMEQLIDSGAVTAVLDITTTELTDEHLGAHLSAGPTRLDAMSRAQLPTVIAPGCIDMANYGAPGTVPDTLQSRTLYAHNPQATLVRINAQEAKDIGKTLAIKANANSAHTSILLPLKATSILAEEGELFHDPVADAALFSAIHEHAEGEVIEINETINSQAFAQAAAHKLLELIKAHQLDS